MADPTEMKKGGFGAFAAMHRERHAARPAPAADLDGARAEALPSLAHGEEHATVRTRGAARPNDGEAGAAASPRPGGEVSAPPAAMHHITWGNDWLSVTAHCAWRELNEAEPRRIEEPHAEGTRRRG